jgi:type III secretion system FlhB-like substrate exporter
MSSESGEKTEPPSPKRLRDARQKGQVARSQEVVTNISLFGVIAVIYAMGSTTWAQLVVLIDRVAALAATSSPTRLNEGLVLAFEIAVAIHLPILGGGDPAGDGGQPDPVRRPVLASGGAAEAGEDFHRQGREADLLEEAADRVAEIGVQDPVPVDPADHPDPRCDRSLHLGHHLRAGMPAGRQRPDPGAVAADLGPGLCHRGGAGFHDPAPPADQVADDDQAGGQARVQGGRGRPGGQGPAQGAGDRADHGRQPQAGARRDRRGGQPHPSGHRDPLHEGGHAAALVTAKGRNRVAVDMRAEAERAGVPVFRNVPLARQLFADTEPNDYVPDELFEAVAEILAWVSRHEAGLYRGALAHGEIDMERGDHRR